MVSGGRRGGGGVLLFGISFNFVGVFSSVADPNDFCLDRDPDPT